MCLLCFIHVASLIQNFIISVYFRAVLIAVGFCFLQPAVTRSLWWQQAQNEEKDRFVTGSPWEWTDHELAILKEGLAR
jgi:protein-S-isoprenylcysteine O-methyltransferase Ste14